MKKPSHFSGLTIIVPSYPPYEIGGMEYQAKGFFEYLWKSTSLKLQLVTRNYKGFAQDYQQYLSQLTNRRSSQEIKQSLLLYPYRKLPHHLLTYAFSYVSLFFRLFFSNFPRYPVIAYMLIPSGFIALLVEKIKCFFGKPPQPIFAWVRGGDWYQVKDSWLGKQLILFVLKHATAVFVQSEQTKQEILSFFHQHSSTQHLKKQPLSLYVIPNGLTLPKKKAKGNTLLYVGSLRKLKGVDVLLQAMKRLPKERLLIVGDGPERASLEKIAPPNVHFIGKKPKEALDAYYQNTKLLILPSRSSEGMPNVILEAYSYGIPVIATKIPGGIAALVSEGKTGYLVPPEDPQALVEAIKKITPQKRAMMQSHIQRFIRQFTWKEITKKLFTVIHDVTEKQRD